MSATAEQTAAVSCRGLTKIYRTGGTEVHALRGVDLDVYPGEMLMLVGPSGCGKTTLISVIAGVLDHDKGECFVYDQDLQHMRGRKKAIYRGKNIGFVFQAFNLIPALTAAENVAVPLLINGVGKAEAQKRSRELLDRVGLGDKARTLPAQLSGGQQQRVAIARSLVHDPKLIVCDEPTSALDGDTGHRIMELLREVSAEANHALIIVTHDSRIFSFGDRIAKMDDGVITTVVTSASDLPASYISSSPDHPKPHH